MAWTEAARRAAAEARRRKRQTMEGFHRYGTPKYDPFVTSSDYRKRLAAKLKSVRPAIRRGEMPWQNPRIEETMREAAYAQMMKRKHWGAAKIPRSPGRPSFSLLKGTKRRKG